MGMLALATADIGVGLGAVIDVGAYELGGNPGDPDLEDLTCSSTGSPVRSPWEK